MPQLSAGNLNTRQLLAGNASGKKITHIVVGTSDTAVTGSETALTDQISKAITGVNYIGSDTIEFVSELVSGDPSIDIREVGLLNEDGELEFRKVVTQFSRLTGTVTSLSYRVKIR